MISPQSRYQQGVVTRLPNSAGVYNLSVLRPTPPAVANYTYYIWQPGDRPDLVAYKQLGNAALWWAIFDINPELIYPLDIPPGAAIRMPIAPVLGQGTLIQ